MKRTFRPGRMLCAFLASSRPCHARQHHVSQKQIDTNVGLFNKPKCRHGILSPDGAIIQIMKSVDEIGANVLIVLNDKDGFPALAWHRLASLLILLSASLGN